MKKEKQFCYLTTKVEASHIVRIEKLLAAVQTPVVITVYSTFKGDRISN